MKNVAPEPPEISDTVPGATDAPVRKKCRLLRGLLLYGLPLILLGAVLLPNYITTRCGSPKSTCINNLRQIDGAIEQWALQNKIPNGSPVSQSALTEYIKGGWPICPEGGAYSVGSVGQFPTCSRGHKL